MKELTIDDRPNDLWMQEGDKYAIIMMYSVNETSEPRFIRGGPYKPETANEKLDGMLNDAEQGRYVCLNSQFVNPNNIISIKVDRWKGKTDRNNSDGNFYD